MKPGVDPASLGAGELVALVHELREQLAEREREIKRLRCLLPAERHASPENEAIPDAVTEPAPGSQEDLLAQLEKVYPEK